MNRPKPLQALITTQKLGRYLELSVSRIFRNNGEVLARFLLIRHGLTDAVGYRITGRLPGVTINQEGTSQAQRLATLEVDAVVSSPLERAIQTAEPLAARLGLEIEVAEEATEVDFGEWSGKTMEELDALPEWKHFNIFRSTARPPRGELMLEVQVRMIAGLNRLAKKYAGKTVGVFSHADVIKAAVMHYAGSPLEFMSRFEIGPASITRIELDEWGPRVLSMNEPCPAGA